MYNRAHQKLCKMYNVNVKVGDYVLFYKVEILEKLKEKGYNTGRLRREKIIGENTIQGLRQGKILSAHALDTVCTVLKCQPGQLIGWKPDPVGEKLTGTTGAAEDRTRIPEAIAPLSFLNPSARPSGSPSGGRKATTGRASQTPV